VVHIVGYAVGSCVVAVIGYLVSSPSNLGWRLLYAMGTLPAMAVLVITPWLYETPHRCDLEGVSRRYNGCALQIQQGTYSCNSLQHKQHHSGRQRGACTTTQEVFLFVKRIPEQAAPGLQLGRLNGVCNAGKSGA